MSAQGGNDGQDQRRSEKSATPMVEMMNTSAGSQPPGTAPADTSTSSPPVTPGQAGMGASLTRLRSNAPEYRPRSTPTPGTTPSAACEPAVPSGGGSLGALPPPMSPTAQAMAAAQQREREREQQVHHHMHGATLHHHPSGSAGVHGAPCFVDYMLVVDFEATCDEPTPPGYTPEIIEFPVVVVDTRDRRIVSEFQSFVRPAEKPVLSAFCMELTGITQDDVTAAPPLQTVVNRFDRWLSGIIPEGKSFIFATDGPYDMCDFMYEYGVKTYGVQFPEYFYRWIDIKEAFSDFFGCRHGKIHAMLDHFGLTFEGRLHSGIDDARNIARIALALLDAGCTFPTVDEIERTPPRQHLRRLSSQHRPARGGSATTSPATQGQRPPNLSPAAAAAAKAINGDVNGESPTPFDLPPPSSVGSSSSVGGGRPLNGNAVRFTPGQQGSSAQQAAGTSSANGSNGSRNTSPSSQTQYPFSYETHGSGLFPSGPMPNGASPGRFGGGGYGHPMPPYGSGPAGGGYGGGGYGGAPMLHHHPHHHQHHQHGYGGYGYPLHPYDPGDPYVTGMGHVPASHHGGGGGGGNGRNSRRYNHALANGYPP